MNGGGYSGRGMDSASLPRIRKHDDTHRPSGADGGRHGSSRDYYSSRDDRRDRDRDRDGHRDRRRSRSPHHRSSRHEVDSYSSSRGYREREREDRYSGRDSRRDDRGAGAWERDRGADRGADRDRDRGDRGDRHRDARRGDDRGRDYRGHHDRPDRGDRGGGGRADRDEFAMQRGARRKSASPPAKKREPTPDLTDVVPITERKRRLTQWDIKPPGYENVTAEQAKLSGMFPLPGAPRQQVMDPSKLQSLINQPGGSASQAALKPSNARQSKRLFLANLPASATEESLIEFFNLQLNGLNVVEGVDPCISCQVAPDRAFAMLEFKTPADATTALALDGVTMDEDAQMGNGVANGGAGAGLAISRPKDYIVPAVADDEAAVDGEVGANVADTQNKISITNIIPNLNDDQVKELLVSFGPLKSFVLVKDRSTEESRGIAFCEYVEQSATDLAVEGMNGMELAERQLKVTRASIGVSQAPGLEMSVNAMSMLAGTTSTDLEEGRVLQLLNMVTAEELIDNEDYQEILEDVKEECEKYGPVLDIKVPRPTMGSRQSAGVGKIFVKFDTVEAARKALQSLAGRKFADRTVVTTYFSEQNFEVNAW